MASLGANVTIPDQVVLVGGTGKHLSDRFSFIHDDQEESDPRYTVRLANGSRGKNNIQDRLGPRRYNGNDVQPDDPYLDPYAAGPRPHVLKRLGQPYSPWRTDEAAAFDHSRRAGRRGGRYNSGYGNSYYAPPASNRYNPGSASTYNYYNSTGYGSAPYSYPNYGYAKPRFNNYTYYNPYQYRGSYGGGNYRGRYNTYAPRSRGGRRGGRYNRNSSRNEVNEHDLDRELDEYRQGTKKDPEAAMS